MMLNDAVGYVMGAIAFGAAIWFGLWYNLTGKKPGDSGDGKQDRE